MARPIRIERRGGWYHITARSNERRAIYRDHRDRQHFCELLAEIVRQFNMLLHAFVLMDEFRDRHADTGRDLVLYLGRKVCGLKLNDLAALAGA